MHGLYKGMVIKNSQSESSSSEASKHENTEHSNKNETACYGHEKPERLYCPLGIENTHDNTEQISEEVICQAADSIVKSRESKSLNDPLSSVSNDSLLLADKMAENAPLEDSAERTIFSQEVHSIGFNPFTGVMAESHGKPDFSELISSEMTSIHDANAPIFSDKCTISSNKTSDKTSSTGIKGQSALDYLNGQNNESIEILSSKKSTKGAAAELLLSSSSSAEMPEAKPKERILDAVMGDKLTIKKRKRGKKGNICVIEISLPKKKKKAGKSVPEAALENKGSHDNAILSIRDKAIENVSAKRSVKSLVKAIENVSDKAIENVSDKAIENVSDKAIENVSDKATENSLNKASINTYDKPLQSSHEKIIIENAVDQGAIENTNDKATIASAVDKATIENTIEKAIKPIASLEEVKIEQTAPEKTAKTEQTAPEKTAKTIQTVPEREAKTEQTALEKEFKTEQTAHEERPDITEMIMDEICPNDAKKAASTKNSLKEFKKLSTKSIATHLGESIKENLILTNKNASTGTKNTKSEAKPNKSLASSLNLQNDTLELEVLTNNQTEGSIKKQNDPENTKEGSIGSQHIEKITKEDSNKQITEVLGTNDIKDTLQSKNSSASQQASKRSLKEQNSIKKTVSEASEANPSKRYQSENTEKPKKGLAAKLSSMMFFMNKKPEKKEDSNEQSAKKEVESKENENAHVEEEMSESSKAAEENHHETINEDVEYPESQTVEDLIEYYEKLIEENEPEE
ncbi:hypothetical protein ENBRE01_0408 [Enteropsectra breve]|nr:hypothetical protein ENBRE01_0408 [Enteropsectra breve]